MNQLMEYFQNIYFLILAGCLILQTGCNTRDSGLSEKDRQTRIVMNVLSIFYGEYLAYSNGKPPVDASSFREFLLSPQVDLNRYNVKDLESLLVSPRDGQPFKIVYGKLSAPIDSPDTPWVAYEQMGINGQRLAVQVRGGVHELTTQEINQIANTN